MPKIGPKIGISLRVGVLFPLLCLLSACWLSEKPLVEGSNAARISFAGNYEASSGGEKGRLAILQQDDGGYTLDDGNGGYAAAFAELGHGWYLLQTELDGKADRERPPFYFYSPLRVVGNELHLYDPVCDEGLGDIAGMEREERSCMFVTYAALEAAALNFVGRIENGTLEEEPEVFRLIASAPAD